MFDYTIQNTQLQKWIENHSFLIPLTAVVFDIPQTLKVFKLQFAFRIFGRSKK